jgi:hypothetical protein
MFGVIDADYWTSSVIEIYRKNFILEVLAYVEKLQSNEKKH